MSEPIDLYTPWHEDATVLRARHVARDEEQQAIREAITSFLDGGAPLPVYLVGARGAGKSHLISLAIAELRGRALPNLRVLHVPEDVPSAATADELLKRADASDRRRSRLRPEPAAGSRAILFLEGLDLHLGAMSEHERRELRRRWQVGDVLVVATGCQIPEALTSRDTAFYGWFHVVPLLPLGTDDAKSLLERVAGDAATGARGWPARREALLTIAGGSPRALMGLALACKRAPDQWAADSLLQVVQQFTAHYQLRFRDLPPQQQRILEALTFAAGPLTPAEVGAQLDLPGGQVSVQCRRMVANSVLAADERRKETRYRITEPMLRYWLEYRSAPWAESRIGILARLLEAVLRHHPALPEPSWGAVVPLLTRASAPHPDQELRANAILSLTLLSLQSPDRFNTWADPVVATRPTFDPLFREAEEVAAALRNRGPLHPELDAYRTQLHRIPTAVAGG